MLRLVKWKLKPATAWRRLRLLTSELGVRKGAGYLLRRWRQGDRESVYFAHPRQVQHPLCVRLNTSDVDVFHQIFVEQEYAPLYDLTNVRLVLDCGANVGYSAACFLSRFPTCHVLAVEPASSNFTLLQQNLLPYGNRTTLIRAGVWSHTAPLVMSRASYRDGREWAQQVRECEPHVEAEFQGISIESLLASSGHERISLLKIDIEGTEAIVFRGKLDWLDKVDTLAIELHDDSSFGNSSRAFFSAIEGRGFNVSRSGELTICRRPG